MKQIDFIVEIDKLKNVFRQTTLIDESRRENDAEHSWHLAMMAIVLSEYANREDIDILRVMKMVTIHDLVEIYAGDTFAYDSVDYCDKYEKEESAAIKIFALLPEDQGEELYNLWQEFEELKTDEAKFAAALDRIQPLLHNYYTNGGTWVKHGVTLEQVKKRFQYVAGGSKVLAKLVENIINESVKKGYIKE